MNLQMDSSGTLSLKTLAISKPTNNSKNSKASDYDLATHLVINMAIELYGVHMLIENAFPDGIKELKWAEDVWSLACKHHKTNIALNKAISKLVDIYFLLVVRLTLMTDYKMKLKHMGTVQDEGMLCHCHNIWVQYKCK